MRKTVWWLCSPGGTIYQVNFVFCQSGVVQDGETNLINIDQHINSVRPALKLKRPAVSFSSETNTFSVKSPISATVTFKVEHGKWNKGNGDDQTVTLTGYEGDTLTLEEGQIPAVGEHPDEGYEAGSWSPDPRQTKITGNTEFTYSYVKSSGDLPDDETTYTITMNTRKDHTYAAYQVFTGDLIIDDDGKKTLSNIQWGTGVNGTELLAALKNDSTYRTKFIDCTNPIEVAEVLGTYADNGPDIEAIAKIIAAHTTETKVTGDTKNAIKGLTAGYYLILDETTNHHEGETISSYMLKVVDDVDVTAKDSTVSSVKKVQDINDSADSPVLSGLQDSADYDIGDDIPYTLTFTLPANYEKYDHYYVAFQDDMSKGLTYKTGSSKIQYGSGEAVVIGDPTAGTTTYSGGHMWIWEIMDLKAVDAAKNLNGGAVITLIYHAALNEDAVIGMEGNPNKLQVEYTSNPNNTGNGTEKPGETGKTPVDINIVYTYKTVFNKVQPDEGSETKPLTGADFKLEKKVNGEWVDVTTLHNGEDAINPTKTGDTSGSTFTFAGLDDGDYKLTETTTPAGFNTIEPIEFTITAEHEVKSDNPALKSLRGTDGAEFTMTAKTSDNKPTGELNADIMNQSGAELPSTGGIGTTIFYVLGTILVLGAGVLLITRRRMNAK